MRAIVLATVMSLPAMSLSGAAFAAGDNTFTAPTTTQTTKECTGAQVWDEKKGKCVDAKDSALDADTLYDAVRELAYAGRLKDAQMVLAAMPDQSEGRVLTYWGFTARKLGQPDEANAYYQRAIATDPDNLLARSYMGQGFVEDGKLGLALAQWKEIRARGGTGSWPEVSLYKALQSGQTSSY